MRRFFSERSYRAVFRKIARHVFTLAFGVMAVASHAQGTGPQLSIATTEPGKIVIAWPANQASFVLEETRSLDDSRSWQVVGTTPVRNADQLVLTVPAIDSARYFRLRQARPAFQITRHAPLDGANEVGVTFRPQIFFSRPIDPTSLSSNNFFATAGGSILDANIVPANDSSFAWLFFKQAVPGGTRVQVTVDGSTIRSADGTTALDADDDGQPGGTRKFEFTTVSNVALPGTSLEGIVVDPGPDLKPRTFDDFEVGVDETFGTADDVWLLPIAGAKVYLIGREDQVVTTGADGRFRFDSVPAGDVKVVVNGNAVANPPSGFYFPEMVLDVQIKLGAVNWTMRDDPAVYLPRLSKTILQTVNADTTTTIIANTNGATGLTDDQRQRLTVEVPANSLVAADGTRLSSGQVGISTVPPELVRDMLPPGILQHTFDITVQAPGIATFATPAPMTAPNVFNAPPGTKLNFLSFDHTTGRLAIEGTGTVSADGLTIRTDPGTGVTHPGWHGWPPPGSGSDPPCSPKKQHKSAIAPVYVKAGVQDYFFADDSGLFTLSFLNAAQLAPNQDACDSTPLVVTVDVPDQATASEFLNGLTPQVYQLAPGQQANMLVNMKPLITTAELRRASSNVLYGAKVNIEAHAFGAPKGPVDTIFIYRFFDNQDDDHADGRIDFPRTFADGTGGVVQSSPLALKMRADTIPATRGPGPDFAFNYQGKVLFDPQAANAQPKIEFIELLNPQNQNLIGALQLRGEAIGKQRVVFTKAGFDNAIRQIVDRQPPIPGTANFAANLFPPDTNGNGLRSDEVGFQPVVDRLYQNVVSNIYESFRGVDPQATNALEIVGNVTSAGPNVGIVVDSLLADNSAGRTIAGQSWNAGVTGAAIAPPARPSVDFIVDAISVPMGSQVTVTFQASIGTGQPWVSLGSFSFGNPNSPTPLQTNETRTFPVGNTGYTLFRAVSSHASATGVTYAVDVTAFFSFCGASFTPACAVWADFDKTNFLTQIVLSSGTVSAGQTAYDFANILNRSYSDFGATGDAGVQLLTDLNVFGQFNRTALNLAYAITHEVAHDLGAIHHRDKIQDYLLTSSDAMGAAANRDTQIYSFPTFSPIIKYALGLPVDATSFAAIFDYYKIYDPLETYNHNTSAPPPGDNPQELAIGLPVLSLYADDLTVGGILPAKIREFIFPGTPANGPQGPGSAAKLVAANAGDVTLNIKKVSLTNPDSGFSVEGFDPLPLVLPPLDPQNLQPALSSRTLTIRFNPDSEGLREDTLLIESDSLGRATTTRVPLRGRGVATQGRIHVLIPNNNLGGVAVGSSRQTNATFATIQNTGLRDLVINQLRVTDESIGVFGAVLGGGNPALSPPITIPPGGDIVLGVFFDPTRPGLVHGAVEILSTDPLSPSFALNAVGTGLAASGEPLDSLDYGNDYVAMETPDVPGAPVLRMKSDANGNWSFFLPPQQRYHYAIFDPVSGLIAHGVGVTEVSGKNTPISIPVFLPSTAPDSDGDGLPDDIEWTIGTNPQKVDTDGNGIDDFTEIAQGLNPLGGRAFPTGVIATAQLQGEAKEVVVEAAANDPNKLLAYVATGSFGLAIVDVSKFDQPVVLSQLKLPGDATDVAVDAALKIAAGAGGTNGLHLIDISDPANPRLIQTVPIPGGANRVAVRNGIAYVPSYVIFIAADVLAVDLLSGQVVQKLTGFGNEVTDLTLAGDRLYVVARSGRLHVIALSPQGMSFSGSVGLPLPSTRLFVANNVAYAVAERPATTGGYQTFDVSDPKSPKFISAPDVPPNTLAPASAIALNGSGLGVLVGSPDGVTNVFDVLNTSDPQNTYSFITRYGLPASANGVTIAGGIAFVADGPAGLVVVNYAGFDTQGQPPTVTLNLDNSDQDGSRAGIQIAEGTLMTLRAITTDDVQVRQVELLVNGQVVQTDVSFPFEFTVVAGRAPGQMLLQARATDTGGNSALSNPITVELRPDTTPPIILRSSPTDGSIVFPDSRKGSITFSEPMAAESINLASVELLDSRNRSVPFTSFELQANDQALAFSFNKLDADSYRMLLHASNITDRAGNALGSSDTAVRFVVAPFARDEATIQWVEPAGGAWTSTNNWLPKRVPLAGDNVLIAPNNLRPGATINLPNSVEIPEFWNPPRPPAYGPLRFANLVSTMPLHGFYTTFQPSGVMLVNSAIDGDNTIEGGTILASPELVLSGGFGHPLTGQNAPLLDGVTLRGNLLCTNQTQRGIDCYLTITNGVTIEGSVTGTTIRGNPVGTLYFLGTNELSGHAVLDSVSLYCAETGVDFPDGTKLRTGYGGKLTIGPDILIHGRSFIVPRNEAIVINRGIIRADVRDPLAFQSFGIQIDDSTFINEGVVEAVENSNLLVDTGTRFTDPGVRFVTPRFQNNGVLRATGSGVIFFLDTPLQSASTTVEDSGVFFPQGRITTEPGRVSVMSGSGIWLAETHEYATTFLSGTVSLAEGARFHGAAKLFGVAINGDWNVGGSDAARAAAEKFGAIYFGQLAVEVRQGLTLNGTMIVDQFDENSGGAVLAFTEGAKTLDGNATVIFGAAKDNVLGRLADSNDGDARPLTIGSGVTIRGTNFTLGYTIFNFSPAPISPTPIVNYGTILADASGGTGLLGAKFTASGTTLENYGVIGAVNGATLTLGFGSFTNGGTLLANASGVVSNIANARFTGVMVNTGVVWADASGLISLNGDFQQTAAGTLMLDLAGTQPGVTHGQLRVNGKVALAGTLDISLVGGYQPVTGDAFDVMKWSSYTGTFSPLVTAPLNNGLLFKPDYQSTQLRLSVSPP
ncbi:MAG: Ig-like domain-containing protein [Verrucomicrobia bacterium]|nr:Ig-like domain-containing protein [Verrucomicrobiota bacterium]